MVHCLLSKPWWRNVSLEVSPHFTDCWAKASQVKRFAKVVTQNHKVQEQVALPAILRGFLRKKCSPPPPTGLVVGCESATTISPRRASESRIASGVLEWAVPPSAVGWGGRAVLGAWARGGDGALGLQLLRRGVPERSPPLWKRDPHRPPPRPWRSRAGAGRPLHAHGWPARAVCPTAARWPGACNQASSRAGLVAPLSPPSGERGVGGAPPGGGDRARLRGSPPPAGLRLSWGRSGGTEREARQ